MSTRTLYGGTSAVLYWKKSAEDTCGLVNVRVLHVGFGGDGGKGVKPHTSHEQFHPFWPSLLQVRPSVDFVLALHRVVR